MRVKRRTLEDFEKRSVALFTTVLVGMMLVHSARAQTAPPSWPGTDNAGTHPVQDRSARMRLSSAQVQQAFQHIDHDKDGRLTRAELSVFPRVERVFERIDTNGDGTISPAEFEEALQQAS
ncbi:MAG TPA: EF-hand domain-containing protein [Ramlibacter sp.]|nr:EF-hand domain-containing protein [Ramlibacter sp.]